MEIDQLKKIVEAALLAAEQPLSLNQLAALFSIDAAPAHAELRSALDALAQDCESRGIELALVASGYRLQVRQEMQQWVSRLWAERRPRYSRALLETLAIIAYRQPMTRGEIEEIRGVSVSSNIMRTLQEREWVRIVGHRDVPGRPALFGTTRRFLDYFSLTSLDKLPTLAEIRDLDDLEPELALMDPYDSAPPQAHVAPPDTAHSEAEAQNELSAQHSGVDEADAGEGQSPDQQVEAADPDQADAGNSEPRPGPTGDDSQAPAAPDDEGHRPQAAADDSKA